MTAKAIEQQAAERYPYLPEEQFDLNRADDSLTYMRMIADTDLSRKVYIAAMKELAGRTASANESVENLKKVVQMFFDTIEKAGEYTWDKNSTLFAYAKEALPAASSNEWIKTEADANEWLNTEAKRQYPSDEKMQGAFANGVRSYIRHESAASSTISEGQGEEIKEGQQYILDKGYNSENVVTVVKVYGKHYCSVTDGSSDQWDTMCYRLSPMESQLSEGTAKGEELKDIIARIIEQNNNPTATAKIIALVEEHYSSQEAKGGEYKFSRDEQKKEIEKFLRASFPEDYFFVDSLDNVPLDEITEIILQYIEIHSAAASQEAKAIAEKVEKAYWQWCKETKRRNGSVLGGSIKEFFQYLSQFSSPTENEK